MLTLQCSNVTALCEAEIQGHAHLLSRCSSVSKVIKLLICDCRTYPTLHVSVWQSMQNPTWSASLIPTQHDTCNESATLGSYPDDCKVVHGLLEQCCDAAHKVQIAFPALACGWPIFIACNRGATTDRYNSGQNLCHKNVGQFDERVGLSFGADLRDPIG